MAMSKLRQAVWRSRGSGEIEQRERGAGGAHGVAARAQCGQQGADERGFQMIPQCGAARQSGIVTVRGRYSIQPPARTTSPS